MEDSFRPLRARAPYWSGDCNGQGVEVSQSKKGPRVREWSGQKSVIVGFGVPDILPSLACRAKNRPMRCVLLAHLKPHLGAPVCIPPITLATVFGPKAGAARCRVSLANLFTRRDLRG